MKLTATRIANVPAGVSLEVTTLDRARLRRPGEIAAKETVTNFPEAVAFARTGAFATGTNAVAFPGNPLNA